MVGFDLTDDARSHPDRRSLKTVELVPVHSSNLAAVGYDPATGEMQIQFRRRGRLYSYADVPPDVHDALINAGSKGGYFNYRVRFRYRTTRLA